MKTAFLRRPLGRTRQHPRVSSKGRRRLAGATCTALALGLLVPSGSGGFPFEASTEHPRLFIPDDRYAIIAARVGISQSPVPSMVLKGWRTHMEEWDAILARAWDAPPTLELPYSPSEGNWSKTDARNVDGYLSHMAIVFRLAPLQPDGQAMRGRLRAYMQAIVDDARERNDGMIGPTIRSNDWGKNATYKGYCLAYDYMYPYLSQDDPDLLHDFALWLHAQGYHAYEQIHDDDHDISAFKHYYLFPWVADGAVASLLTIYGDLPELQEDLIPVLDYCLDFKWEDYRVRAHNYVGTYSGYREERLEEDLITAALLDACLIDRNPFQEFAAHFLQIDDWTMYMTRSDLGMSDETGDGTELGDLRHYYYNFPYISASYDRDPATHWFLDRLHVLLGDDYLEVIDEPWVLVIWNDKTYARKSPELTGAPLSRYFGDLSWDDGGNSQYAHFRSDWHYGEGHSSIVASFLCGPVTGEHDTFSNGHFAIFRGGDILTASTGVYDGTAFDHCKYYYEMPISENTILIYDEDSPYVEGNSEYETFPHTEGFQAPAPQSTGGEGVYMAEDAYDDLHEMGRVTKFTCTMSSGRQVTRLECDLSSAYPNTHKPDLWPERPLVEAVLRDVLFLAERYFVVYDRIQATSSEWRKGAVIHCPDKTMPRLLDGSWTGGTPPHPGPYGGTPGVWTQDGGRLYWDNGGSRLFVSVILPDREDGRRIVAVGGTNSAGEWNQSGSDPSFEFWLRRSGLQYPWNDQYMGDDEIDETMEGGQTGWWRLELEPEQDSQEDRFLVVLEPTSQSQLQPTNATRIPSDDRTVALSIEDADEPIVVALPRGLEPMQELWYEYDPQGWIPEHPEDGRGKLALHVVDGLEPGEYLVLLERSSGCGGKVRPGEGGVREPVHRGSTTEDGLLSFETTEGGRLHVIRAAQIADRARAVAGQLFTRMER